jgi:molecular chaperone DnaK
MGLSVGIDLGTTFSSLAIINESGKPEIIKNSEGEYITPSVIYFSADNLIVGKEAKEYQAFGEGNVASFFKRAMGDPNWIFFAQDHNYTPTDLSSLVIKKLKNDAESLLNEEITHAVITVPAYFSDLQRRNTIEAGEKANLKVMRIINEPTAAAISYGVESFDDGSLILVYDLGGGTFDVSLVRISKNSIEVIVTDGNHELGGKDWDDVILRFLSSEFELEHGIDPLLDDQLLNDLLVRAESAKRTLSSSPSATILLIHEGKTNRIVITRQQFEQLTTHLMETTINLLNQVITNAKIDISNLTGILCVGGSTRMPMVRRYLEERIGKPLLTRINVDEAVALGAAIQANIDMQNQLNLSLLHEKKSNFNLTSAKEIKDITSHSLGMVAINEDRSKYINSIIIPKNNFVPSYEIHPYQFLTTSQKNNEMEVYITQGESERPLDCTILGRYRFIDIPHIKGNQKAIIDITYAYDTNGIVQITAAERNSKQKLNYVIEKVEDDLSWMDEPPPIQEVIYDHVFLYIAIDLSGSMSGEPLIEAQKAAKQFISKIDITHTSVGIIAVADKIKVIQTACQNTKKLFRAINSLNIGQVGIGNSGEPFTEANKILRNQKGHKFILVLADGVWAHQSKAIKKAKECHESDIEVIAIGFGSADYKFLKAIASSEEGALFTDLSNLVKSFDRVAQVITEQVNLTTYSESHNTKKQSFLKYFK